MRNLSRTYGRPLLRHGRRTPKTGRQPAQHAVTGLERLESRVLLDAANLITEFVAYGGADVRVDREVAIVNGAVGSDESLRIGRDADTHGLYAGDRVWIDRDSEVHGDIRAKRQGRGAA